MTQQSVVITQGCNPKFDANKTRDGTTNPEYLYRVEKTINTLRVKIGQWLTPTEVEDLIAMDVNITVGPLK